MSKASIIFEQSRGSIISRAIVKIFIIQAFLLSAMLCYPQNPRAGYDEVVSKFQTYYNSSNYEAIHELFDEAMKNLLSKDRTTEMLSVVRSNFGSITKMEISDSINSARTYRTYFNNTIGDISIALNPQNQIIAWFIPRNELENSSILKRNSTKMIFPFKKEAFVYWGGQDIASNYHMGDLNQQYAYDILMVKDGAPYSGDPLVNENYYVFGQEIIAPCDAKVVRVIDGIPDNIPGEINKTHATGNTIVLETSRKEYLLFAHLKFGSISVRKGDLVLQGQVIAQCGNSGNTTQAHLHLQLQNTADLYNTIGAKLYFDDISVNGQTKRDYMPIKEDFVKNK